MIYCLKIYPVTRNQSAVLKLILRFLGPGEKTKAQELTRQGGNIENLTKEAASRFSTQLRQLGVLVEVEEVQKEDLDDENPVFKVKLIDAGRNKLSVVTSVREITGFGLKDSKILVDNLGIVGIYTIRKEADRVLNILISAGAKAEIQSSTPQIKDPIAKADEKPIDETKPESDLKNVKVVFGTITDHHNTPLQNLRVEIFDVEMRDWHTLSDTFTDSRGRYRLEWTHGFRDQTADIAVKVYTVQKDQLLFQSTIDHVRFNASDHEEINITIELPLPKKKADFDSLVNKVNLLAGLVSIADLKEDKNFQDISFLSKKLQIPVNKLEHLVIAHRLYKLSGIDPGFFYSLYRINTLLNNDFGRKLNSRFTAGLDVDVQTLLRDTALTDSKKIEEDLLAAGENNIVSQADLGNLNRNIKILSQYR